MRCFKNIQTYYSFKKRISNKLKIKQECGIIRKKYREVCMKKKNFSLFLLILFVLFTIAIIPNKAFAASIKTCTFSVKDWGGKTEGSYVSDEIEGNGYLEDDDVISAKMANFIPSSGQIKGNQTNCNNNYYLYNTIAMPGDIKSIAITGDTSDSNYFKNNLYVAIGDIEQGDITDVSCGIKGTLSDDKGSFSWHFSSGGTGKYFKLYSNEKFTNGSLKGIVITVTYETSTPVKEIVALDILGNPTKTEYEVGETFNTEGLTVQATYSDASTGDVTDDATFTINPATFTTASDNTSVKLTAKVDDVSSSEKTINNIKVVVPEPAVLVSDILPAYLLTSSNNKWFNDNGYSVAYVYGEKLYFQEKSNYSSVINNFLLTTELTKSGDDYTATCDGRTITFKMNANVLESIIVSSSVTDYLNGTYFLPPFADSQNNFETSFTSSETTISLVDGVITISSSNGEKTVELVLYVDSSFTKVPDGTYVFSDSQESGTALKCSGVSGDNLTKSYAATLIDEKIDECWHLDSGIVTIAHNDETNFVITVDAENTNGCDVDITINVCEEAPVEWTEWEKFESGAGVWKYSTEAYAQYVGEIPDSYSYIYVRSQKNDSNIKQLKLVGWGAQSLSTLGVDLIIDWNMNTNEFTIQKQNTGSFFSSYNEYVMIQDYNSFAGGKPKEGSYNEETKSFKIAVVYYISAGYFGYDYEEFKLIDTDIKANNYTHDVDIKLIKLYADDVTYAFQLKEDIELGKTYASSDMQYYCTLTPSGSLYMYGLDATLKVTKNTLGEIHAEATMNVKGVTFNITYDEPHVHILKATYSKVNPTCIKAGNEAYYECGCGKYFSDEALTKEITNLKNWLEEGGEGYIAPLGHHYSGEVTYVWDNDKCTASWHCDHEGCNEVESETVTGSYVKDTDATCIENEKGHLEATFESANFAKQSKDANSFTKENTALGHHYSGEVTYVWDNDKCTASWHCDHEGCNEVESETVTGTYVKDTDATCTENEKGHLEATFESANFAKQVKEANSFVKENTALGHHYSGEVTYVWDNDKCTASRHCDHEGCDEVESETAIGVYVVDTDATHKDNEFGHYEVTFNNPNFVSQVEEANSVEIENTKLKGLAAGAVVGISIGSLLLVLLVIYALGYFFLYRNGKLDNNIIAIIYKFLPKKEKEEKGEEATETETKEE